jgi:hypothetical protein
MSVEQDFVANEVANNHAETIRTHPLHATGDV